MKKLTKLTTTISFVQIFLQLFLNIFFKTKIRLKNSVFRAFFAFFSLTMVACAKHYFKNDKKINTLPVVLKKYFFLHIIIFII
jgi:hypothetical protein